MTIYRFIVLLHVLSALAFVMAHGVSMMMFFKVRNERNYENLCNYLDISSAAMRPAMLALHGVEATGIVLTLMVGWWRMGWIWVSLVLFVAIGVLMGKFASGYMRRVRKAMGMVSAKELKKGVRPQPAPYPQLMQVIETGRPKMVLSVGLSLMSMMVALMVLKPF
jgi:hypothetical protein